MVSLREYQSLSEFDDKRQKTLESLLYSDEQFIYGIDIYDALFLTDARASKLVLTNQRVIEFKRAFIKESSSDFRLEDIASIEYDKGYVMRKITMEGQGISKEYQTLENYGRTFVTAVREQMSRNKEGEGVIDTPSAEHNSSEIEDESDSPNGLTPNEIPNKFGSLKLHIVVLILTFWTFGFGNLSYAGYSYYKFQKVTSA